jgi:hypothetical protein
MSLKSTGNISKQELMKISLDVEGNPKIIDVGSTAWIYETFIKKTEHLRAPNTTEE